MRRMHELLERQLQRIGARAGEVPTAEAWSRLLEIVSRAYADFDLSRGRLERSLSVSSREMRELQERLLARTTELESQTAALTSEVARRRQIESRLRHDAQHDGLTLLPNRAHLLDRLAQCLSRLRRHPDLKCAVLFLDLDNFKVVNDSLGHEAGDKLLVECSQRLLGCVRDNDSVSSGSDSTTARLGGDEFVILLEGVRDIHAAIAVADRIQRAVAQPLDIDGHVIAIGASIGVTLAVTGEESVDDLLREADTAMYAAKHAGKSRVAIFDQDMHAAVRARLRLEHELRAALGSGAFELHYQPIIALETAQLCGFEALVRWRHPDGTLVMPGVFISIAEEIGIITTLGRWVLRTACAEARAWNDRLTDGRTLSVSVNVSRYQLLHHDLVGEIEDALAETGLSSSLLKLEVTEAIVMADAQPARDVLSRVRALGVEVHMDDFGAGYSSLSSLHQLDVDGLKIDRAFAGSIGKSRTYVAVIDAIVQLAHVLDKRVICEGIEDTEQLAQMLALGCDGGQGYLFSKPIPADEVWSLIDQNRTWSVAA
jgi:diguanylate cyclase (GGDEF)-like protein